MSQVVALVDLAVGQRMRLVRIDGGKRLKRRLLALGLTIGGEAELVQRRPGGVVLARGGNRVAANMLLAGLIGMAIGPASRLNANSAVAGSTAATSRWSICRASTRSTPPRSMNV